MKIFRWLEIRRHNHKVYKEWVRNGRRVVRATVGWRRDPIYEQDGYTEVPREGNHNATDWVEYQKVIR